MGEVIFCITNDGSAGLFNEKVDDIYHSTYGAHAESCEKFLDASGFIDYIKTHDEVALLDICYGIGYNTKTALDKIIKLNKVIKVKIDALEYDNNLINISPLLKHQKIDNVINEFLIENANLDSEYSLWRILKYFFEVRGLPHINWQNLALFCAKYKKGGIVGYPLACLLAFQHNIYYNYIPFSMKKGQKLSNLSKTTLTFHSDDARRTVQALNNKYNFIFLDAFTPKKLPTLWSLEFFKELYRLLSNDGVLVTYSSSAAVRSAMIEAGFFVGKSMDANGKIIGTLATKNKQLIKHELSEFDLGLLKTRAGIFYRDENLNGLKEAIIASRESEVKNSTRQTTSQYMKQHSRK